MLGAEPHPSIDNKLFWTCSQRGLQSHLCYHKRGRLLPYLFTLTSKRRLFSVALSKTYIFQALPGAFIPGARTFLYDFHSGCITNSHVYYRFKIVVSNLFSRNKISYPSRVCVTFCYFIKFFCFLILLIIPALHIHINMSEPCFCQTLLNFR